MKCAEPCHALWGISGDLWKEPQMDGTLERLRSKRGAEGASCCSETLRQKDGEAMNTKHRIVFAVARVRSNRFDFFYFKECEK